MSAIADKVWNVLGNISLAVFRGRPPGILGTIARILNERRRSKQVYKRFTHADFLRIQPAIAERKLARKPINDLVTARTISDMQFAKVVQKLKTDFHLARFIETGTYDGDTSLFMSLLFEKVYTCDVIDHPKRPDFFLVGNIVYETISSPDFLLRHATEFGSDSMFYLDAHWWEYWPIRDELKIIFSKSSRPVLVIDDFDTGNGLSFDSYHGHPLNMEYILDLLPPDYRFIYNTSSYCGSGKVFLFPPVVPYGCELAKSAYYNETSHGLWDKV